ncbi:Retinitis pigmentosa 1-like 1 protein [Collichthys lucidus]|uniref:Retinitis pigmentosa 1-like 1 protein n=1 Tax=Collichthys lucidus TaxID=240159 RepID=A0A4U5TXM5_COLLU|nr:Retinitis pigmentosa 1-like 1 protein [Collichthys lucidus]
MWDPRPPSKHVSPPPQPPPSNSLRLAHVTTATPAKRITFYKSGDSQFGGIRMAVHKRSFKCFDALLDDLSQKVPLPFGVRTVTTPRGTHAIKHLEQLQDGGCYLCSDRRQAKPVNMELASKRPTIWYHHGHRPHRPESSSATQPGHLSYRQRRIMLVKNSEPGMRRSIVLSRRSTRSLRAFLDEVSEVMQFHVRKLYTAEGRRIDSVQSLITCPGVLVCVGREAFSPLLVNFIRKSSEEKLPGLGPRTPGNGARSPATQGTRSSSHGASECSEGHESKKNVNFGLETKKSIIHPRSDSSNRSARFSLSSEKSYGNGVSTCSQARPGIMNEDIEKRVLVNKDGSLSVEMRVRFRLQNEETLQWSTQIKKSPTTNECCPLSQAQPHYLQQGQSESCSDPDSTSFDPEGVDYSRQPPHRVSEASHCPCCYQRHEQQYDLWENPAHIHKKPPVPPPRTSSHTMMRHTHSSSSSSSCNSRRVVRCRAQLSNSGGGSGSEQSQLVQEEMCLTEQVEHRVEVEQDGDTHVEVRKVSRSCSRSEVVAVDSNQRPFSQKSVEDEAMMEDEEERPPSAISSSSHILQSLKEDQDDDLPPSVSQCSHSNGPSPTRETTRNASACSARSAKQVDGGERGSRAASAASSCHCGGAATPHTGAEAAADDEDEEIKRADSGLSGSQSRTSSVCPDCGGSKRVGNSVSNSRASQRSHHSHRASPKPATPQEDANNGSGDDDDDGSVVSTQSNKSNLTKCGRSSAISNVLVGRASSPMSTTSDPEATEKEEEEERAPSATSATSHASHRSHKSGCDSNREEKEEERSHSAVSAQSNLSAKSRKSHKSAEEEEGENAIGRALSSLSAKSGALLNPSDSAGKAERPESVLSAKSTKSHVSAKSGTSHKSNCSHCVTAVSPGAEAADEPVIEATGQEVGTEAEERAASATSAKSNRSHKSTKASERSQSPRSETGGDGEKRAESQMSGRSLKSAKSSKSNNHGNEIEVSQSLKVAEEKDEEETQQRPQSVISTKIENEDSETGDNAADGEKAEDRAASVLSGKSASSAKSRHTNCDTSSSVATPAKETTKPEVDSMQDRAPSATSGKSHASASKSQKSNCTAASPNPNEAGVPSIETNGGERPNEERGSSAISVKSKSSQKSGKNLKPVSPSPNVTIKTPEGVDKEGQTLSPRRTRSPRTHSPRSPHSAQQLSPGPNVGETRGPSALSVHSRTSAKSSRSSCHCGAASAKKDKEVEDKEEGETGDNEETSERAPSALSSSTAKQRRESGGSEQPLSRNSSGSVSLGLPEDQETADSDSGKSSFNYPINDESKGPKSTEQSAMEENVKGTRSPMSQKSNHNGSKSTNPPAVDIPTIETPGQSEDKGGEQKTARASSALSAKSSRSCCSCSVKAAAGQLLDTTANNMNASDNRTSSALSSASAKIRSKSPASASVKNASVAKTTGDSANNEAVSRPASKSKGRDVADNKAASVHSKSPCRLKPKTANSQRKETPIEHSSRPNSKVESCTESILSHSLSAADLLKETMAAGRPQSRQSKASETSDKPNKSERSGRSQKSRNQAEQEELTPACLPNASPNEVVSDWLRSIPTDSTTLALGDELHGEEEEKAMQEKPGEEAAKESPEDEAEEEEDKEEEADCDAAEEGKSSDPAPGDAEGTSPHPNTQPLLSGESLPRNWHSSVAVMKVLLSSSPGRCRSMPEVSPVYGRRLSTSARGFLDCLAQLQLIEPVVSSGYDQQKNCNQRYEDIMAILQSLWLTEPRDIDVSKEQVTPPRSSSGVGMSSGSGGSGKENENQGGDETTQNKTNEEKSLHEDKGAEKVVEEDVEGNAEVEQAEPDETSTEQTKTIDEEPAQEPVQSEEQSTVPPSLDKATENPSSSEAVDSSKSPTDNERETLEGSSSGTPPTVLRASLSRKASQDPDPVWVLHLLKKIEKQFMNHYITAMAEFKVRWDLDDSLILNTMISELRDEVSRRIQSSIQREMRKIQSRAGKLGKSPRPPQGENLSRESTMTEKRRRMLKVMKNQSVKTGDSLSDGEMTGDCSDQRSDDEYCPCDACVRKKMAARPLRANPPAAEAPVVMEFDLLKILQLKKSPSPAAAPPSAEEKDDSVAVDEEGRNLEVVEEEEEEENKEDIKADVLEEAIPEEAEEKEDEEVEEEKEENSIGDEEQVNGGEEAGEEETSGNGEAEEAQCQCQCGGNEEESDKAEEVEEETAEGEDAEETSNNTGEDETADDEEQAGEEEGKSAEDEGETETGEEESDKETVKEATTGEEGESTEHSEGEEKEGEAEVLKPEEEEDETLTGKESGEEEASGETEDDGTAKNSANDESTSPAEEFVEGNVSASAEAEDEDDGDDGAREGEESGEQEKEASEEEGASAQEQGVTEGEEADAEESDSDNKRPSDTSADESGCEGGEKDCGEEEAVKDAVEEDKDGEVKEKKGEAVALLHQFTRTSVESQPGSLEDINTDSPQNPVNSIEVPKISAGVSGGGGGAGQRRSRSPARVKRRKPKECDEEVDDY